MSSALQKKNAIETAEQDLQNEMGNKIIIKTGEVYDFPGFCLY